MWSRAAARGCNTAWCSTKNATADLASEQHGVEIVVDPISANYLPRHGGGFQAMRWTAGGFKISNPKREAELAACGKIL